MVRRRKAPGLAEWFHVRWDTVAVHIDVSPPGRDSWSASFGWSSISRVCLKAEDMWVSDAVYVFTSQRPESYVIPTEADGGQGFWDEVLTRGLFDPDLAIKAVRASEGLYCWPAAGRDGR
jgi:hypothetical protein